MVPLPLPHPLTRGREGACPQQTVQRLVRILAEMRANPEVKHFFTIKACVENANVCATPPPPA